MRSAEVTILNGFNYFIIVDSVRYSKTGAFTTPTTSQTTASVYGYGNYAYGRAKNTTTGGQTYIYSKPRVINSIECFIEKPETDALVYDAPFIVKSIKGKYGLKD